MFDSVGEDCFQTSGRHQTNKHFYQKHAVATRRTSIFIKNRRSPPDEQAFLLKTSGRRQTNKH